MIEFNEPYEKPSDPQQVRNDFYSLVWMGDNEELLVALSTYLDTDTLSQFIDDRLMGRV